MNREQIGPEPARGDTLGLLQRERWLAADAGETARVAELDAQIARLSAAGSARPPLQETTGAKKAAAAHTTSPTKGTKHVRSPR